MFGVLIQKQIGTQFFVFSLKMVYDKGSKSEGTRWTRHWWTLVGCNYILYSYIYFKFPHTVKHNVVMY